MIVKLLDGEAASLLFSGWQDTMIWSCLQGVMGEVYGDDFEEPRSAMAVLGDFAFLAGELSPELALFRPWDVRKDFMILVPQDEVWARLIEGCHGGRVKKITRYAMKKEPDVFHRDHLKRAAASLPAGYELKMIDRELYEYCGRHHWCRDLTSQYPDYQTYRRLGLGVMALKGGEPVSGASSYSTYREGIEIEIDTKEEYRRQGLAYSCAARLILECLDRGLYPSWDAHTPQSMELAKKLGYHLDYLYTAYILEGR